MDVSKKNNLHLVEPLSKFRLLLTLFPKLQIVQRLRAISSDGVRSNSNSIYFE